MDEEMKLKAGDIVRLKRDVAQSLIGIRGEVIRVSPLSTLTIRLLEDGNGSSCWKSGNFIHLKPYNVEKWDRSK